MLCTIIDIRGDYAYVKYDDTGVVSEVAIALLPFGVDLGDRLKFENYEFSLVVSIRYRKDKLLFTQRRLSSRASAASRGIYAFRFAFG